MNPYNLYYNLNVRDLCIAQLNDNDHVPAHRLMQTFLAYEAVRIVVEFLSIISREICHRYVSIRNYRLYTVRQISEFFPKSRSKSLSR